MCSWVVLLGLVSLVVPVASLETHRVSELSENEHIRAMQEAMRELAANLEDLKFEPHPTSDLGESAEVPPAPPPGPAPNDVTQALLEAQASADEKKEQAKMYLKPPGCRPTTSEELQRYSQYRTDCAHQHHQTPISLNVTNLEITDISDGRGEISVILTLYMSWTDPAISTQPMETLWTPNIDFQEVVKKRPVGNPLFTDAGNAITMRQVYELTLRNPWDLSKYPFDTQKLSITVLAPVLTEGIEPITAGITYLKVVNHEEKFKTGEFSVKVSRYGLAQGPTGSWGSAQQVEINGDAKRKLATPMFGSVLPILFTPLVAYSGFFLTIEHIVARVTLGGVSLLAIYILCAPANFSDGMSNSVGFGLDTWLSWYSLFQSLCVCVTLVAHAVSHKVCQDDATKSGNIDTTFKILFPLVSISTLFAAYTVSYWKSSESVPTCIGLVAMWSAAVVLVMLSLEKKTQTDITKSRDFPGI